MSSYFVEKEKVLKIISGICQFDENQDLYKTFWNSSYDVDKNETGELNLQSAIASNFKDDVTNIINSTGHYEHTNDLNSTTLITILNSYHEQPNIIRACVKELVSPLMDRFDMLIRLVLALSHTETKGLDSVMMASVQEKNMTLIHRYIQHIHVLSKILYVICKVISYKHVLSILPHEVIIKLLECCMFCSFVGYSTFSAFLYFRSLI